MVPRFDTDLIQWKLIATHLKTLNDWKKITVVGDKLILSPDPDRSIEIKVGLVCSHALNYIGESLRKVVKHRQFPLHKLKTWQKRTNLLTLLKTTIFDEVDYEETRYEGFFRQSLATCVYLEKKCYILRYLTFLKKGLTLFPAEQEGLNRQLKLLAESGFHKEVGNYLLDLILLDYEPALGIVCNLFRTLPDPFPRIELKSWMLKKNKIKIFLARMIENLHENDSIASERLKVLLEAAKTV